MNERELQHLITAIVQAVVAELEAEPQRSAELPTSSPSNAAPAPPPSPVVSSPTPPGRCIRLLVGNTDRGLEAAVAAVQALKLPGPEPSFEVAVAADDASLVERVRLLAPSWSVHAAGELGCPFAWMRSAEAGVALTLDRVAAVRASVTVPEQFVEKALLSLLHRGRPCILATDGLNLDAPKATDAFRQALREPVDRLTSFGARCVAAGEVGHALAEALGASPIPPPAGGAVGAAARGPRPLISAADVESAQGELVLPPGALVTPLAWDRARELGVKLRRLPQ